MAPLKPWTVMVYLAADNNLTNFGVNSLREMQMAGSDQVNIVAEFNTGPRNRTKRYFFDGSTPFGSIEQNVVKTLGPTDASDPKNLTDFIVWAATRYPAHHYFVIIWGHAGGVDDAFPRMPNRSFAVRHKLLFKGVLDAPQKGVLNAPQKGVLNAPQKSILEALQAGSLNALHGVVIKVLHNGLQNAFQRDVLGALRMIKPPVRSNGHQMIKPPLRSNGHQNGNTVANQDNSDLSVFDSTEQALIEKLNDTLLAALQEEVGSALKSGILGELQQGILDVLHRGVTYALQIIFVNHLQRGILAALRRGDKTKLKIKIGSLLKDGLIRALEDGVLMALQEDLLRLPASSAEKQVKSIAFVDHPASFLSNADLKTALKDACKKIKREKLDIVGMDACNMSMVEIGVALRQCASLMVASQDDIPDASWPYDRVLAQLLTMPGATPPELACLTSGSYVNAYRDYFDQPVTLSVLNLRFAEDNTIVKDFKNLANELKAACKSPSERQAIKNVRSEVRSFGGDEFIDLIHFCQLLAVAPVNGQLSLTATKLNADFRPYIVCNKFSNDELNCNGVSIYFPQVVFSQVISNSGPDLETKPSSNSKNSRASDSTGALGQRLNHLGQLAQIYSKLEFSRKTGWGDFLKTYLAQEQEEIVVRQATTKFEMPADQPPGNPAGIPAPKPFPPYRKGQGAAG